MDDRSVFKKNVLCLTLKWPFITKTVLERNLSLSLANVPKVPSRIEICHELFGHCFSKREPKIWWDPDFAETKLNAKNSMDDLKENANTNLKSRYGVIKVWPIEDELSRTCTGILVVHSKRDTEVATKVLGVLVGAEAERFLSRTSQNIHSQLAE